MVVVFGVSALGVSTAFASMRPYLLAVAVLLLAVAYYWTYFRRSTACAADVECADQPAGRANRLGLWLAVAAVTIFAVFPYMAAPLAARLGESQSTEPPAQCCAAEQSPAETSGVGDAVLTATDETASVTFKVEGMSCASCEAPIKLALERTPGVRRAQVSYERGEAVVEYDPRRTNLAQLREVINNTGYRATEQR